MNTNQLIKKKYIPPVVRSGEFYIEVGYSGSIIPVPSDFFTEAFETVNNNDADFWGGNGNNDASTESFNNFEFRW